jgi:hypothetical protein
MFYLCWLLSDNCLSYLLLYWLLVLDLIFFCSDLLIFSYSLLLTLGWFLILLLYNLYCLLLGYFLSAYCRLSIQILFYLCVPNMKKYSICIVCNYHNLLLFAFNSCAFTIFYPIHICLCMCKFLDCVCTLFLL